MRHGARTRNPCTEMGAEIASLKQKCKARKTKGATVRQKRHRQCKPSCRKDNSKKLCTYRNPASGATLGNPVEPSPSAFKFIINELPAPSPLNPCLPLPVRISARASAPRLADLRALAPIGARGHISSRIVQLCAWTSPRHIKCELRCSPRLSRPAGR